MCFSFNVSRRSQAKGMEDKNGTKRKKNIFKDVL
jgi:hypothetical protein